LLLTVFLMTGCSRTLETNAGTDVYPHDPQVIQKINLGVNLKTQW
jgi:hypothetical protein